MYNIAYIFICSVLMRIKGGGPDIAPAWFRALDGSLISAVLFGILCLGFYPWWQAGLMGLGWYAGNAPSIGEEIGAIGGYQGNWYTNRDSWIGGKLVGWVGSDRLWGWLSGTLRGVFSGLCLAIPSLNPWFILTGAMFPVAYFIGVSIEQYRQGIPRVSWHWAEWAYGAIIGAAFYG